MNHPDSFKTGFRVLLLVSRNKDGAEKRSPVTRVTDTVEHFDRALEELWTLATPEQRVYSTANARSVRKAARLFQERQLAAQFDPDPFKFYHNLESRWASCMMDETAQEKENKVWMFDCDDEHDLREVADQLLLSEEQYRYNTVSGTHVFVKPFNRSVRFLRQQHYLHTNPLMFWGKK